MAQYAKRLDKSREFGTYHPPDEGRFYNQGGFDFDHEGNLVDKFLTDEQKKALAKKPPTPPAPPKPKVEKSAGGEGGDGEEKTDENENADGLNLEAWLRGEEEYDFPDVQKAVKARYSVWKTSRRDLLIFLVEDQKLVEVEKLSDEFKKLVA